MSTSRILRVNLLVTVIPGIYQDRGAGGASRFHMLKIDKINSKYTHQELTHLK